LVVEEAVVLQLVSMATQADLVVEVLLRLQELFIVVAQVHLDKVMLVVLDIILAGTISLEVEAVELIQLVQTPHKLHLAQAVLEEMV
jgi:hypothetical protein